MGFDTIIILLLLGFDINKGSAVFVNILLPVK